MFKLPRLLLVLLLLAATLRAQTSLENAWRAQALLGPGVWSRVITIRNVARGGTYPGTVHALVFELTGILWFYADINGTQSFSLRQGQVEQEKNDFGPLLRDIEPGFGRWTVVEKRTTRSATDRGPLRNGCFIESVVALRERLTRGVRTEDPRLLSYYSATRSGQKGHTVLAYDAGDLVEIFDPDRPGQHFAFPKTVAADPLALARELNGREVGKARYLSLRPSDLKASVVASAADVRSSTRTRATN